MAETGFGASVELGGVTIPFNEILSMEFSGQQREPIETTHATSTGGWKTFMPSDLIDPGQLELEVQIPTATWNDILSLLQADLAETIITFSSGTTWTCDGFLTEPEGSMPIDDRVTASLTVKFSGEPVVS